MLLLGRICEAYFVATSGQLGGPFLTRAEVLKSGQNHWFKITRAEKDLGYKSYMDTRKGMNDLAAWFGEHDPDAKRNRSFFERWGGLIAIILAVIVVLGLFFYFLAIIGVPGFGLYLKGMKRAFRISTDGARSALDTAKETLEPAFAVLRSTSLYQWWVRQPEQLRWIYLLLPMPFVSWHIAKKNALRANETAALVREIERQRPRS